MLCIFLTLSVYLFFSNKLNWSAIIISFLPIIRTEGIILLPLFILAYSLRKSYWSILLMSFGFFLISVAGLAFHDNFFWLITEIPYGRNSVYGSGDWYHFLMDTRYIMGFHIALLFLIGLVINLSKYFKKGIFQFGDEFFILLLIYAPFILYYAAHSTAWAMGIGSLGLIRVIGAVLPLASLGAVFGFEFIDYYLRSKKKVFLIGAYVLITLFMANEAYHIYRWGFYPSTREKLLTRTADYLRKNELTNHKIVYFDAYLIYELGIDPYDYSKASWMISNRKVPSKDIPINSIIVWDSHFGNNEGRMPLQNLLDDSNLVLLKKIVPDPPFKVLGGYDYEIDVFRKGSKQNKSFTRNYRLDYNKLSPIAGEDSICLNVSSDVVYAPAIEIKTYALCQNFTDFEVNVQFDIKKNSEKEINELLLILTYESGNDLIYKPVNIDSLVNNITAWGTVNYQFQDIGISPGVEVLKVYIWNKGKNSFLLDNFKVDFVEIEK